MTVPDVPKDAVQMVTVTIERHVGTVVVVVTGEVDLLTAPQLEQPLLTTLTEHPSVLVIDLLGVSFLSSAGLAVVMKAHEKAGPGTRIHVVAAGAATLRPLELTGLARQLDVYATRADALNSR